MCICQEHQTKTKTLEFLECCRGERSIQVARTTHWEEGGRKGAKQIVYGNSSRQFRNIYISKLWDSDELTEGSYWGSFPGLMSAIDCRDS